MLNLLSNRISIKVTGVIVFVLVISMGIIFSHLSDFYIKKSIENKEAAVKLDMFSLQETLSFLLKQKQLTQLQKTVAYLGTHIDLKQAWVVDSNNNVIASSKIKNIGKHLKDLVLPEQQTIMLKKQKLAQSSSKVLLWRKHNSLTLYAIAPLIVIRSSHSLSGAEITGFIITKHDLSRGIRQQQQIILNAFYPIIILLFLVAILLVFYIHFTISKRIHNVKQALDYFSKYQKKSTLIISGDDEISDLANVFMRMENQVIEQQSFLHQYKHIVDTSTDMLALLDNNYRYKIVNDAYLNSFGLSRHDVIGQTPADLFGEAYYNKIFKNNAAQCMKGDIVNFHRWIEFPKMDKKYMDVTYVPYVDEDKIQGFIVNAHDVTVNMENLKKIQSQHQEQLKIVNAMFDAVVTTDKFGTVLTMNMATKTLFGFAEEELIGANVKLLMPTDSANKNKHDDYLINYRKKENISEYFCQEVTAQHKNKQTFSVRLSVSELPLDSSGERRFIAVFQDLSKIKHQEELFNRSQKMDALGKLTGGIAHDHNNMLGVILGYSELLIGKLQNQPQYLNYVKQIQQAGQRGAELTRKLLSFSRQQSVQEKVININDLINDDSDLLRKTLPLVEIHFELNEHLWMVNIDDHSFRDMLLNMAINAMHAMAENTNTGKLIISSNNETLSGIAAKNLALPVGEYVSVSIEDNGSGMDEVTRSKIFEPFFTTKGEKGTGLGLAQVYGFIHSSAGAINVYSEFGQGTRFILYFPRYYKHDQQPLPIIVKEEEIILVENKTILVVDDEPQLCNLVEEILNAKGYQVLTALNAETALTLLSKNSIDLMLTDIIMPKMNGYQLAEKVRKLYPHIAILFASGFQGDLAKQQSEQNEVMINKPYNADILVTEIRQALSSKLINKPEFSKDNEAAEPTIKIVDNAEQKQTLKPLQWSAEMSIDNGVLDKDHQQLHDLIHQFYQLTEDNVEQKELQQAIVNLIKNTKEHFAREELAMKICKYPYFKNHCEVHQLLIDKMETVLNSPSNSDLLTWLIVDFPEAIVDHIKTMDKPLIPYLDANKDAVQQALRNANG